MPKKFAKLKKSFIDRLSNGENGSNTSSFCAFPTDVSFNGQDHEESVILLVRKHPIVFFPHFLLFLLLLITPIVFTRVIDSLLEGSNFGLSAGSSLLFVLLAVTLAVDIYFKWYYTVNIITDQRIVDVDFNNVLYHKFAEAQLEKIEDVTHKPVGIFSSIFDYGNVYIQTAGAQREFVFDNVPRPRDVQDTLLDLLELKQEGKI